MNPVKIGDRFKFKKENWNFIMSVDGVDDPYYVSGVVADAIIGTYIKGRKESRWTISPTGKLLHSAWKALFGQEAE